MNATPGIGLNAEVDQISFIPYLAGSHRILLLVVWFAATPIPIFVTLVQVSFI
jgi:hypothetical protein